MLSFSDSLPLPGSSPWVNGVGWWRRLLGPPSTGETEVLGSAGWKMWAVYHRGCVSPQWRYPFTSFQSYHGDIDLPVVVRDGTLASVQNFPWEGYPSTPPHEALQTRLWLPLLLHPPNPCLISISYVIDSINHRAASLLESWFLQASFLTMLTLRNKGHLEHFKTIAWLARLLSFANAILSNISKTLNFFSFLEFLLLEPWSLLKLMPRTY